MIDNVIGICAAIVAITIHLSISAFGLYVMLMVVDMLFGTNIT